MDWFQIRLIIIGAVFLNVNAATQSYFNVSAATGLLDQKVAEFANGDLLIGNSSTAPLLNGNEVGVLILSRFDNCGNTIWVKEYNYDDGYLELNDLVVNQNDEIFMYGSHFKDLAESIFIAKIEDITNAVADFRLFHPGSIDHFTYSIDLIADQMLIYGLLLDSSSKGFLANFDQELNLQGAVQFAPFETTGAAVFASDGGAIGWTGAYVYKFDGNNDIEWSYKTEDQRELLNIGGPYSHGTGWIIESHSSGSSFLYKLNTAGQLVWTSDRFEKTNTGGDLHELADGNLLFVYNRQVNSSTELLFLIIDQDGKTIEEKLLNLPYTLNTGVTKQRIRDQYVNVIGSKNLFSTQAPEIENFILQFTLDNSTSDCYTVEDIVNTRANDINITFTAETNAPSILELEPIERRILEPAAGMDASVDMCASSAVIIPTTETMRLPCNEIWDVSLPNADFTWDDGFPDIDRQLSIEGIYSARNIDCQQQELLEYSLEVEECPCQLYVPSVFSPNGDETNDTWQIGVFCDLESIQISIFDKWGELIFSSRSIENMWSGQLRGQNVPSGIYSAFLFYTWLDETGTLQEKKIIQDLTLLR